MGRGGQSKSDKKRAEANEELGIGRFDPDMQVERSDGDSMSSQDFSFRLSRGENYTLRPGEFNRTGTRARRSRLYVFADGSYYEESASVKHHDQARPFDNARAFAATQRDANEVLGRDLDESAVIEFAKQGWDEEDSKTRRKLLSQSVEARSKGVKPEDYGSEAVDPDTLNDEERANYDALSEAYGGGTVYRSDLDNWNRHGGGPGHIRATLSGAIKSVNRIDDTTGQTYSISAVSPAALDMMGGEFNVPGLAQGSIIILPKGSNVTGDFWEPQDVGADFFGGDQEYADQVDVYGALGDDPGGFLQDLDDAFGTDFFTDIRDKYLPHEFWAAADVVGFGVGADIWGGRQAQSYAEETFGALGWEDYAKDSAVITEIAIMAASLFMGPAAFAMLQIAKTAFQAVGQKQTFNQIDWSNVVESLAMTGASFSIAQASKSTELATRTELLQSATTKAVATGTKVTAEQLENIKKIAELAGQKAFAGGRAALAAISTGRDPESDWVDALVAAGGSLVGSNSGATGIYSRALYSAAAEGISSDDWSDAAIAGTFSLATDFAEEAYGTGARVITDAALTSLIANDAEAWQEFAARSGSQLLSESFTDKKLFEGEGAKATLEAIGSGGLSEGFDVFSGISLPDAAQVGLNSEGRAEPGSLKKAFTLNAPLTPQQKKLAEELGISDAQVERDVFLSALTARPLQQALGFRRDDGSVNWTKVFFYTGALPAILKELGDSEEKSLPESAPEFIGNSSVSAPPAQDWVTLATSISQGAAQLPQTRPTTTSQPLSIGDFS